MLPENQGRAAALNTGLAVASGDVLIRCDDDLEPPPDWLAHHLRAHESGPVGAVGLVHNVLPATAFARTYGAQAADDVARQALAADPATTWRFWGGNVSVDRATWERVGPYDDVTFRHYGWEDVDYGYRVHLAGIPVRVIADLAVPHHAAAVSTRSRAVRALYSGAGFGLRSCSVDSGYWTDFSIALYWSMFFTKPPPYFARRGSGTDIAIIMFDASVSV